MLQKKDQPNKSINHSRKSSISSQGSDHSKNKFQGCYIQISPRLGENNSLAFKNEIKEMKIITPSQESITTQQEITPKHRKTMSYTKDESLKKSRFSQIVHTIDELQ